MIWISLVDFPAIWKNDQRVLRKYLVHLDEASGWFRPEALTNLALNSQLMWFFGINLIIPPAQHWIRQSNGLLMFVGESSALFQFYQITQRGFWSTMWIDTLLNGCFHEKLRKDMIYMVIMVYNGRTWEHIVKDWWTLINKWWTLMNIDENWWTLMNIDENWWNLMNIAEKWWNVMNIDGTW